MYEHGQLWAVRRVGAGQDPIEIMGYIAACYAARINTEFHRGALETLELIT